MGLGGKQEAGGERGPVSYGPGTFVAVSQIPLVIQASVQTVLGTQCLQADLERTWKGEKSVSVPQRWCQQTLAI